MQRRFEHKLKMCTLQKIQLKHTFLVIFLYLDDACFLSHDCDLWT